MASHPPPVASTKETTNYARLCRLLIEIGAQALRDRFNYIHNPTTLYRLLYNVKPKLESLRSKRILNPIQWGYLYPAISSKVSSESFDITTLCVLLTNICGLTTPATGWKDFPDEKDASLEADSIRIRHFRNDVYAHVTKASVDDTTFKSYWSDIRDVLVRLGGKSYEEAITKLENECMDPTVEEHYKDLLKQWRSDDDNIKDKLNKLDKLDKLDNIEKIAQSNSKMLGDLKDQVAATSLKGK